MIAITAGHDGCLSDSLAAIVGRIREMEYLGVQIHLEQALRGSAEQFVRRLADHLRQEEEVLFPALREASAGAAADLEPLEREHRTLHLYAVDLARRIREHDVTGAREVARSFLSALMDHVGRETDEVNGILVGLDPKAAERVAARLKESPSARECGP